MEEKDKAIIAKALALTMPISKYENELNKLPDKSLKFARLERDKNISENKNHRIAKFPIQSPNFCNLDKDNFLPM